MLQKMLSLLVDTVKKELLIGKCWIIIHKVSGDPFLSKFTKYFENIPLWRDLPGEDLKKYPFSLLPIEAVINLLNQFIDCKFPGWQFCVLMLAVLFFSCLLLLAISYLYFSFFIEKKIVQEMQTVGLD